MGRSALSTRLEGGWAVIVIADDGPGISRSLQERIYEPFFTTKSVGRGPARVFARSRDDRAPRGLARVRERHRQGERGSRSGCRWSHPARRRAGGLTSGPVSEMESEFGNGAFECDVRRPWRNPIRWDDRRLQVCGRRACGRTPSADPLRRRRAAVLEVFATRSGESFDVRVATSAAEGLDMFAWNPTPTRSSSQTCGCRSRRVTPCLARCPDGCSSTWPHAARSGDATWTRDPGGQRCAALPLPDQAL